MWFMTTILYSEGWGWLRQCSPQLSEGSGSRNKEARAYGGLPTWNWNHLRLLMRGARLERWRRGRPWPLVGSVPQQPLLPPWTRLRVFPDSDAALLFKAPVRFWRIALALFQIQTEPPWNRGLGAGLLNHTKTLEHKPSFWQDLPKNGDFDLCFYFCSEVFYWITDENVNSVRVTNYNYFSQGEKYPLGSYLWILIFILV